VSGHKLFGPKGVGALITRRRDSERIPLAPLMHGGGQEQGLRPGTLPVPLIAGLGKAAELAIDEAETRAKRCRSFRERLLEALRPLEPRVNGDLDRAVPHIVNLSFPGVDAEEAMEELSGLVAISDGSACTSESKTCSHVLDAMGADGWRLEGALRFSWCHTTEEPDWPEVVSVLKRLQQPVSPRA
jgi:cysteine desulfurase